MTRSELERSAAPGEGGFPLHSILAWAGRLAYIAVIMSKNPHRVAERHPILSDLEVQETIEQMSSFRRPGNRQPDPDLEDKIRFMAVSSCLRDGREARGLSLHHVAASLDCGQESLHDLEAGRLAKVDAELLQAYIEHLGMSAWFGRWKIANAKLASRLGLADSAGQ